MPHTGIREPDLRLRSTNRILYSVHLEGSRTAYPSTSSFDLLEVGNAAYLATPEITRDPFCLTEATNIVRKDEAPRFYVALDRREISGKRQLFGPIRHDLHQANGTFPTLRLGSSVALD